MDNFFAELKRRHIYRVAAAYAVVAWALIQLVNNIAPMLKLPDWIGPAVLVLLLVGFPVALIFAWTQEMKASAAAERAPSGKSDWILTGALGVVIVLILYEQFAPRPSAQSVQQAAVSATPAPQPAGIALAVLPFVNLSGDAGQEFFSDGMTEEITSALAKVHGLTVIGRTSAFEYKGQNRDLRAIAQALGVTHLIEGSVRKDGNRVRITAQLIRADNAAHLWTENYDRNLTDIFATQEDIAHAIAGALQVPLGLAQGETLVRNRTADLASYDQYLRAKTLYRAKGRENLARAIGILEPLVMRDPDFAPAWALLAYAYNDTVVSSPDRRRGSLEAARRDVQAWFDKAESAARKAMALDASYVGGYGALATVQFRRGKWLGAEDLFKQAVALDPDDADMLARYSGLLTTTGRFKQAIGIRQRVVTLEPTDSVFNSYVANSMLLDGQTQAAISILEPQASTPGRNFLLATAYAAAGRYSDAADTLLLSVDRELFSRSALEDAARIVRTAPATANAPETLPAVEGQLSFVYAYVGALPRVMENFERDLDTGYFGNTSNVWMPDYKPLRKMERFKAFLRKAGLVDYWRVRGWPDLCRPIGADDFACE